MSTMKYCILSYIFFATLLSMIIPSIAEETTVLINQVVEELTVKGNWKSKQADSNLYKVLQHSPDQEERLTAKILLAQYLGDHAAELPEVERARMRQLCSEVAQESPNSWQGQVAQFNLVAERGFSGNYSEQVISAQQALKTIDFELFEAAQAPAARAIHQAYGGKSHVLREAMKLMLANALCEEGRLAEAEQVYATIQDREYALIIQQRIDLAKKAIQRRIPASDHEIR